MTLNEYIDKHFKGNKSAFARANDIPKQRVTDWINAEYYVIGDEMRSPAKNKRKLKSK